MASEISVTISSSTGLLFARGMFCSELKYKSFFPYLKKIALRFEKKFKEVIQWSNCKANLTIDVEVSFVNCPQVIVTDHYNFTMVQVMAWCRQAMSISSQQE